MAAVTDDDSAAVADTAADDLSDPTESGRGARETSELLAALASTRQRRRWPMALGALAVGIVGTVIALPYLERDESESVVAEAAAPVSTVAIEQTDLVWLNEFEADLAYGETFTVRPPAGGVVTEVAAPGTILRRGDVLAEVDGEPVLVGYGAVPGWRSLDDTAVAGIDVQQLEENLVLLGFDADGLIDVDESYLWGTTLAVRNLETSFDLDVTGVIDTRRMVFVPGPVLVADSAGIGTSIGASGELASLTILGTSSTAVADAGVVTDLAAVGTDVSADTVVFRVDGNEVTAVEAGLDAGSTIDAHHVDDGADRERRGVVLSASSSAQRVSLDVPANEIDGFAVGDEVEIVFPDESATSARLEAIAAVAEVPTGQGGDTDPTLEVTYAITGTADSSITEGPVTIRTVDREIRDAVVVPVRALVTLADGGHALEIVADSGDTRLVAVETGEFQDGLVQVAGEVEPGQTVVVP